MATLKDSYNNLKASFTADVNVKPVKGFKDFVAHLGEHTRNGSGVMGKAFGVVGDVLHGPFKIFGAAVKPVAKGAFVASAGVGAVGGVAGVGAAINAGHGAATIAKQPIAGVMEIGARTVRGLRRHKIMAGVVALGVAGVGLLNWVNGRAAAATANSLEAQAQAAQNDVLAVAQGAPVSYKNSVSADEAALLSARQAEGQAAGHAQTVAAARTATPETAASL